MLFCEYFQEQGTGNICSRNIPYKHKVQTPQNYHCSKNHSPENLNYPILNNVSTYFILLQSFYSKERQKRWILRK